MGLWVPGMLPLVAWSRDSILSATSYEEIKDTKKPDFQKEAWKWERKPGWEPGRCRSTVGGDGPGWRGDPVRRPRGSLWAQRHQLPAHRAG